MRILTWNVLACIAGLALGLAAFTFVSGPYRYVAAGVVGLAATLALWPMSAEAGKGIQLGGGRRLAELEREVARLTEAAARQDADRERLLGVLRDLESWAGAHDGAPAAGPVPEPGPPAEQGLRVAERTNGIDREKEGLHGAARAG